MIIATAKTFISKKSYRYLIYTTFFILILGVFGFRFLEHWRWIDCVNYAVSTMVTTGNAGVLPKSDAGKIFNIFYMFTSVVLILLFVNTVTQHIRDLKQSQLVKNERHQRIVKKHMEESVDTKN
ncbi:potassium channel family protein [Halpernia frigidisoli]|uniref:Ion channel n=1 Tax=Halpernia frigidisoli TaxID=1125876 RepID=A0A1I3IJ73_9FLAO|nr:potassium channel family protein [Halpernia frigidisoli]SFI47962.1 Ion channel [Halpernia frigidisoli]